MHLYSLYKTLLFYLLSYNLQAMQIKNNLTKVNIQHLFKHLIKTLIMFSELWTIIGAESLLLGLHNSKLNKRLKFFITIEYVKM